MSIQNISAKLDGLLERAFVPLLLLVLYYLYRKFAALDEERKEQEFTDTLYGTGEKAIEEKKVANSAAKVIKEQPKTDWKSGMIPVGNKTAAEQKALDDYEKQEDKKTAAQYAQRLKAALNPSGNSWLSAVDGTKEAEIYAIFDALKADKSKYKVTYSMVADAYKSAYGSNLRADLESELDAKELARLFI